MMIIYTYVTIQNAEEWCKSHSQTARAKEYCDDIRQLLHCGSAEQFEELLDVSSEKWSATFFRYFNSRLSGDIRMSSRFSVQDSVHFDNHSGVSTTVRKVI